jgi:hypothetical protein
VSNYIIDVETRVAGIPCIVRVKNFTKVVGSFNRNEESDMDYHGYSETDWDLLDRRGRRAAWLDKKLQVADVERIESEIERALS